MDHKIHIPELNTDNYLPWLLALRSTAIVHNAQHHLEQNPPLPSDPALAQAHNKSKHQLIAIILSTVPSQVISLVLTPTTDPTPYDLLQSILSYLDTTNKNDHKYLKSQAESMHFVPGMTLQEYVSKHEALRTKMIASKYPTIDDPQTTVEFMIDGLKHNPSTVHIGRQMITHTPTDIKDFVHRYNRILAYEPVPATPSTNFTGDYFPRRYPQRPNTPPKWKRQPPTNPCQFHLKRGLQPLHTDDECRHPGHPKFHAKQQQATYQLRYTAPHGRRYDIS